ncbi:uncharacterized protein LOC111064033 [Nilaparvata lugens]|uniref:uncharacterized protein LOC111064033 n=1 Tax=Nilaparvata lugens TaxID=108931 RepID=UPI00193E9FDF|nr:uncharacterized protein LOC111064033 [Nilaparvata lugens]
MSSIVCSGVVDPVILDVEKETTTTSSNNDDAIDEPDDNLPSTSGCTGNAVPDHKHQNIQNPITESFERIASLKEGGGRHSTITLCILFFIRKDIRPFQVIEGQGFKRLMNELAPGYKIPSVKYIEKRLNEKFELCATKFKELLCSVNSLCLTTDIWTETMRSISGENFVTISKVVPIVSCLVSELDKFKTTSVAVEQVLDCVKKEVQKRFEAIEYNDHAAVASLLDPRFKNLHSRDPVACTKAIRKLRDLIKLDASVSTSSESDEDMAASSSQAYDFWQHHKELAHWQKRKKSSRGSEGDELSVYPGNPVAPLKSNPLEQWDEMKSVFPLLYRTKKNKKLFSCCCIFCSL